MMHMSQALGVNCTYCHNTRSFSRLGRRARRSASTAWYGIRMVRDLNGNYIEPLTSTFPANRLGAARRRAEGQLHHLPPGRVQAALRRQHDRRLSRAGRPGGGGDHGADAGGTSGAQAAIAGRATSPTRGGRRIIVRRPPLRMGRPMSERHRRTRKFAGDLV